MAPSDTPRDRAPLGPSQPSYRPTRDYDTGDNSMRNLAFAAVGIALVVMGGVWALQGRHAPQGVPVIEPDSTPLRIKPANPGGMQVVGADDAMQNDVAGVETDQLAPPPETPAPQALHQQASAAITPAAPPVAVLVPKPAVVGPLVAPPPAIVTPAIVTPPIVAPAVITPAPVMTGGTEVQLAALDSEAAAHAEWVQLSHRMPNLLAGHTALISRTTQGSHVFWRLRTGGFHDIAAATGFCGQVRAAGGSCTVAAF